MTSAMASMLGYTFSVAVAAVVHAVAAIQFPVVVFGAAAVDAEGNVAVDADLGLVLPALIGNSGHQGDELGKVAAVQLKLSDLFAGDCTSKIRRLGFHLGDAGAFDRHFCVDPADLHRNINASFLSYA